ncbi:hypothetical protein DZC75_07120 [Pseudomonas parafulva]|uniref:Filamentous hemagglutinin n=2 Tax=Pseudomonas parafulva TaxID=157782 RepID=A0AAI8P9F3_9PSED|nr:hypothetical protein DZC75_07120 [Pseudomonas parafulva]
MFRRTVAYDVPGLLQGDPSNVAMPSLGVDKWGGLFVSDKDLIQAKYISEGWLTPAEQAGLEKWDRETDWLNRLAGKQLSVEEKASRLVELTSMAGMGIIAGRGGVGVQGTLPAAQTVAQFEKSLSGLSAGERVARIKSVVASVIAANGMVKDTRLNGRDVYRGQDGKLYALDTLHGCFKVLNPKNGKHMGEVDFEFNQTKPADTTGRHNLK